MWTDVPTRVSSFTRLATLAAVVLSACAGTVAEPVRSGPDPRAACPEAPASLGRVAELALVSRKAREARANLLVSAHLPSGERIVATLHPPRLALAEGVLAAPRRARRRAARWLRDHVFTFHVELQAPKPLQALERAPSAVSLLDDSGKRYALLALEQRRDGAALRYRLTFEPPRSSSGRLRLELTLPVARSTLKLRWALAQRTLERFDELPLLFELADFRRLHRARRAAILGDFTKARELAGQVALCGADPSSAQALLKALAGLRGDARVASGDDEPGAPRSTPRGVARLVALREALTRRLAAVAERGLLDPKSYQTMHEQLGLLQRAHGAQQIPAAVRAALAFDRALAAALASALWPPAGGYTAAGTAPPRTAPVASSGAVLSPSDVTTALRRRLAFAARGFEPRFIDGAREAAPDEVQPLLTARQGELRLFARARERVAGGWWHPGVVGGLRYTVRFVDRGTAHWANLAREATSPAALQKLAERVLSREIVGPQPRARALALQGLVDLRGTAALGRLMPLVQRPGPAAADALRALAGLTDQRVTALLHQQLRSPLAPLRAAAAAALGRRGKTDERGLVLAALRDPASPVARAAARALLRRGVVGVVEPLTRWLAMAGSARQGALSVLAENATPAALAARLRRPLLRLSKELSADRRLWTALARLGGGSVEQAFRRAYDRQQTLRPMLLEVAARRGLRSLLQRVGAQDDVSLQRIAVRGLAALDKPPEKRLRDWLAASRDPAVRLAAQVGLARLGKGEALLALGPAARGGCQERSLVVPVLSPSMNRVSRRRLLLEALSSACRGLPQQGWRLVARLQHDDLQLLRAGLGHRDRAVRVQAALTTLGLRRGPAFGELP